MNWIDKALQNYFEFLKEHMKATPVDDQWYSISTPFLNMFNDYIEIYCCNKDGKIYLSDDGETLRNLSLAGVNLSRSETKQKLMNQIMINYGIREKNQELILETDMKNFAQAKHNFLSAILEISDFYVLSKPNTISMFKEDVQNYLEEQEIIYTAGFIAKGNTGLEFTFSFQIAGRKREILINTFNVINKSNLTSFLFDWGDIKEGRERVSQKSVSGLAIINDQKKPIDSKYLDAIRNKGADYILYSERNKKENIEKLNANAA